MISLQHYGWKPKEYSNRLNNLIKIIKPNQKIKQYNSKLIKIFNQFLNIKGLEASIIVLMVGIIAFITIKYDLIHIFREGLGGIEQWLERL